MLLLAVLWLSIPSPAQGQSVAERWNSRALEAVRTLTKLDSEMKALRKQGVKRDSERFRELELAMMLERAFADHLDPKRGKELRRTLPGGDEVYALVLSGKKRGSLALNYLYESSGSPMGVRLLSLPEGWSVLIPGKGGEEERRLFVDPGVSGKGRPPLLVFELSDACASFVKTLP